MRTTGWSANPPNINEGRVKEINLHFLCEAGQIESPFAGQIRDMLK